MPTTMLFDEIKAFLKSETLEHFIETHKHPLAVIEKTASVGSALQLLTANQILSVPVVDEDGEYAGAISVNDILRGLHRTLVANLGDEYINEVEAGKVTAEEMNNVGFFFIGKKVSTLLHDADIWMKGDAGTTLLSVVTEGFQIKGPKVHHRIYVCDPNKPAQKHFSVRGSTTVVNNEHGTEKEGASSWRPTDVVSQSDVVKLLWEHKEALGLANKASVEALGLSDGACISVPASTPAIIAFDHMAVDRKSSIGIVDEQGKLIGNLSASDIRDVPFHNFGLLLLPVWQYIAVLHGLGPTAEDIAAGKKVEGSPADLLAKLPVGTVSHSTTFAELVEKLVATNSNRGLHRVYVTDAAGKPQSIITLTDVLRTVVKYDELAALAAEEEEDIVMFDQTKAFLQSETLTHFIETHHHNPAVVDKTASVGSALQLLQANKVLSLPVLDEDGEYAGAISVIDILKGLHRCLVANLGDNYVEEVEGGSVTREEMNNVGFFFIGKQVSTLMHDADIWMKGDAETTLLSVITEGFQIKGPKVHHRIYICDPNKPAQKHFSVRGSTTVVNVEHGTEKEGASSWRPTDTVSQSDVVKLLWEHKEALGLSRSASIRALGLTDGAVLTVPASTPAVIAFDHMVVDHKSSVGIVDEQGKLIGNLSASDIRDVPFHNFGLLLLPVWQYIAVLHGLGPTVEQVMAGAKVEGTATSQLSKLPLVTVGPTTKFAALLEKIVTTNRDHALHRIYVADQAGKPLSIVTLTDVLRAIVTFDEVSHLGH